MKEINTSSIWYELRNAVWQRDFSRAQSLLNKHQGLRHMCSGLGETVLHYLAVENDIDGVKWLHNKGFDINVKNGFGTPVIFEVAQLGYKELLLWFIEKGVDLSAIDEENQDITAHLQESNKPKMVEFLQERLT